jgi:hypothetical protein
MTSAATGGTGPCAFVVNGSESCNSPIRSRKNWRIDNRNK